MHDHHGRWFLAGTISCPENAAAITNAMIGDMLPEEPLMDTAKDMLFAFCPAAKWPRLGMSRLWPRFTGQCNSAAVEWPVFRRENGARIKQHFYRWKQICKTLETYLRTELRPLLKGKIKKRLVSGE